MATVRDVLNALVAGVQQATGSLTVPPIVFIDVPPNEALANLARDGVPLVSIFDSGMAENATSYAALRGAVQLNATGIITTVSGPSIQTTGNQTITVSGVVNDNDAISATVNYKLNTFGCVYIAQLLDGLDEIAAGLAAAINADTRMDDYVTATSAGPVVTVVNHSASSVGLVSYTGNTGTQLVQVGMSKRQIQISLFTKTAADRELSGDLIFSWLNSTSTNFGLQLADTSWMRTMYVNDRMDKDTHMHDIYRWDFLVSCQFGITTTDILYSVLNIEPVYQIN